MVSRKDREAAAEQDAAPGWGRCWRLWIGLGAALVVGAAILLVWNECRHVKWYHSVAEGAKTVTPVRMDRIDPANDGRLVHLSGLATTGETLRDPLLGVAVNGIKLRRGVWMHQWRQRNLSSDATSDTTSDTASDTASGSSDAQKEAAPAVIYEKIWADRPIPSGDFMEPAAHANPPALPFPEKEFQARSVTLGAFALSAPIVESIDRYRWMPLGEADLLRLPEPIRDGFQLYDGALYSGADPADPAVGDTLIRYRVVEPVTVTVIARQKGNLLVPLETRKGPLALTRIGTQRAETMLPSAPDMDLFWSWIKRGAGFTLLFLGLVLILRPVSQVCSWMPVVADVPAGAWLLAFLGASALGCGLIAVTWFSERPALAAVLFGAAAAFLAGIRMLPSPAPPAGGADRESGKGPPSRGRAADRESGKGPPSRGRAAARESGKEPPSRGRAMGTDTVRDTD